jgi:hypothetical protein
MFSVGHSGGYITLEIQGNVLILRLFRDMQPRDITAGFQIAHEMDWLEPNKNVLIDLRHFVGSVDWGIVRELSSFAPWAQIPGNGTLCAYLMAEDDVKTWLVTIVGVFYPGLRSRIFSEESKAMAWLATSGKATMPKAGDGMPCKS